MEIQGFIQSIILKQLPFAIIIAVLVGIISRVLFKSTKVSVLASILFLIIAISIFPIAFGTKICGHCNSEIKLTEEICPHCNERRDTDKILGFIRCPRCNNQLPLDTEQCKYCGCNLNE